MKIAFFTEGNYTGKVERSNTNMRTDSAWICALDATHHNLLHPQTDPNKKHVYDLGIIILPKKNINHLMMSDIIGGLRFSCKKLAIMQEGPNWNWQDYKMEEQIWYFNTLCESDFLLCHNQSDVNYYKGLTGKNTYVMPSLMIEDTINSSALCGDRKDVVMIGGNMTSWYGGFDSMIVANEFECDITAPSMGRKIPREEELDISHLPYMDWTNWVKTLSTVKYGVHLMRTHAAGTFALNCSFLGIPCIGYKGLDTQEKLHPSLTVPIGDLVYAKSLALELKNNPIFYKRCSAEVKLNYVKYNEENYKKTMNTIFIKEGIKE
jgi:hypothetical protein